MFEKSAMLYCYVETPLHAGSGSSVGVVDLPIQRERATHYPLVQASGVKGKLRAEVTQLLQRRNDPERDKKIAVLFGPDSQHANDHAGALSPGDARLLLFPVRSLAGVFAWTTSYDVLARFHRDLHAASQPPSWKLDAPPGPPGKSQAWTAAGSSVEAGGKVVLEEFTFHATAQQMVADVAKWLADNAFPQSGDYQYFRDTVLTGLVILPEEDFRDFTQFATEVVTRIRIDQAKKTAAGQALWSEEHLPSDTLLYSPLHASRPRTNNIPVGWKGTADEVLQCLRDANLERIQLGGDETVGRGIVRLHLK